MPFAFRPTHTPMLSTSDFPLYGGGRGERPFKQIFKNYGKRPEDF